MTKRKIAIIGAGPAGLMAAERLTDLGHAPTLYDAMPSPARKFLMAGKSGLNITHGEDATKFLGSYLATDAALLEAVEAFGPDEVRQWMTGLGIESFEGPSGRIFPRMMKASPLLRAWLFRLTDRGVKLQTRHRWCGWDDDGALRFSTPNGPVLCHADAVLLAMGGASWSRLGSDGEWASLLDGIGAKIEPFAPSNAGFLVPWTDALKDKFAGSAVKSVRASIGGQTSRAEFVITKRGVESGAIYQLSAPLLAALQQGDSAELRLDLTPDVSVQKLAAALEKVPAKQSLSNRLRKGARLSPIKISLLREGVTRDRLTSSQAIAEAIKSVPLTITAPAPLDEAISTAGGVAWDSLDTALMLRARPGVFCAGEMIAWDAPTGGYLLTGCLATGRAAADGLDAYLSANPND